MESETTKDVGQGGRIVSRAVFAHNAGITEKTLRDWIGRGMPGALDDGRVEVRVALGWVIDRQAQRIATRAAKEVTTGGSAEQLRRRILAVDLARKKMREERE